MNLINISDNESLIVKNFVRAPWELNNINVSIYYSEKEHKILPNFDLT